MMTDGRVRVDNAVESTLSPLAVLVSGYAPRGAQNRCKLALALDARLAGLVRSTSDPTIGAMRLTWWHGVLKTGEVEDEGAYQGRGDPLVDAMSSLFADKADRQALGQLLDGWEALIEGGDALDLAALDRFARGRGALFRLMAAEAADLPDWLDEAGAGWALWDLAAHLIDRPTAVVALAGAARHLAKVPVRGWPRGLAPQRVLSGLARDDAAAERVPEPALTPARYRRSLWLAVSGGG